MATPTAVKRLTQDYRRLMKESVPYVRACPLESNILEWWVWITIIDTMEPHQDTTVRLLLFPDM